MNIYDRHEKQVFEDLKSAKKIIKELNLDCAVTDVAKLIQVQRNKNQKERFIDAFCKAFAVSPADLFPSALEKNAMELEKISRNFDLMAGSINELTERISLFSKR
jgi:hypothetical protein